MTDHPSRSSDALLAELRDALGDDGVLAGDEVTARAGDGSGTVPCVARAVLRPRTTQQLSAALAACHDANQPVVPQGGLTGLVGGGVAGDLEVAITLERMTAIEEIDPVGRTMTVQAGAALQSIQEAAEAEGLLFPLDLGARGSCTIGGNVATNAGGNRTIRYGMTRDSVLGLEAVLADGTVLSSLNKMVKNNAGYDLKHLFVGSEGTLGIVTRVVLRLERRPRSHDCALLAVPGFTEVVELLRRLEEEIGGSMSAFEVMWREFYELVTGPQARTAPPIPHGDPYYVLVESLGSRPEQDAAQFEETLGECMEAGLIGDAVLGRSRTERDEIWALRDDVEQLNHLAPIFTFDVSLRIADMESYVADIKAALTDRWPESQCVVFGHLGDGNLHVVVSVGDRSEEARNAVEEVVYGHLEPIGGSVSAEHGIGFEKRAHLGRSRTPEEVALMKTLKRTLDPRGILNPGRVFETEGAPPTGSHADASVRLPA
ncbi:MAG: FAD-binding oxidoreductase [Holophagales bacterium]|nr:FAD-binding oxidoreductase [Holophagales bacterium]MYH26590.1 FAD-binding oxidoreductase [Holophagales bacterium]